MSIRNVVFSILAVGVFGSFAMAQGQPNRPNQPNQPNQPQREGFGGRDGRGFGNRGPGMMRRGTMMRRGGMARRDGMMNFERLNLTDAQKQRIQTIMETNRRNMESTRAQFAEIARLTQLKHQGLLTTEQGTRLTSLQAQMQTNAERSRNEILGVLTADQRTLFDQMRNERGNRGRGMRDRMPMRRGMGMPNRPGRPARTPQAPPAPIN